MNRIKATDVFQIHTLDAYCENTAQKSNWKKGIIVGQQTEKQLKS